MKHTRQKNTMHNQSNTLNDHLEICTLELIEFLEEF